MFILNQTYYPFWVFVYLVVLTDKITVNSMGFTDCNFEPIIRAAFEFQLSSKSFWKTSSSAAKRNWDSANALVVSYQRRRHAMNFKKVKVSTAGEQDVG